MKLISTLISKKAKATVLFMLTMMVANARLTSGSDIRRVFWNKFDVVVSGENTVVLSWNVTEYNNKSFLVQYSTDGIGWRDLTLVSSKNNAEPMVDYSYTYNNENSGKQYYRLQDVDVDHNSTGYSPVRTVMIKTKIDKSDISIWPNPATDHINITGFSKSTDLSSKIYIYDLTGKMVAEKQFDENGTTVYVQDLPAGTYVVRLQSDKGKIYNQKFIRL